MGEAQAKTKSWANQMAAEPSSPVSLDLSQRSAFASSFRSRVRELFCQTGWENFLTFGFAICIDTRPQRTFLPMRLGSNDKQVPVRRSGCRRCIDAHASTWGQKAPLDLLRLVT
jgi:hypothetical protein